jgi:hypothetical protein
MTTFVRRVPAEFDTAYWRVAPGYMERELGAVSPVEAVRHEHPKGFASIAGKVTGQQKDQSYCFAPYDGLRGLGMPEAPLDEDEGDDEDEYEGVGQMPPPAYPGGPIVPLGEPPPAQEPAVLRAIPYVIGVVGLLWLFNKTAKEMTPPRPAR